MTTDDIVWDSWFSPWIIVFTAVISLIYGRDHRGGNEEYSDL